MTTKIDNDIPLKPIGPPPPVTPTFITTPPDEAVRLVRMAELHELVQWVIPLLLETHPKANGPGIYSWLQSALNDRQACLVRTENVVGLFQSSLTVLDDMPTVSECFIRQRVSAKKEVILLYGFVLNWAKTTRAREVWLNVDTNVDFQHFAETTRLKLVPASALTLTL